MLGEGWWSASPISPSPSLPLPFLPLTCWHPHPTPACPPPPPNLPFFSPLLPLLSLFLSLCLSTCIPLVFVLRGSYLQMWLETYYPGMAQILRIAGKVIPLHLGYRWKLGSNKEIPVIPDFHSYYGPSKVSLSFQLIRTFFGSRGLPKKCSKSL